MRNNQPQIQIKRAYDPASPEDGFRVYVDRIWPRGLRHETFSYDLWEKDIAPSNELRQWFHTNPEGRWPEFVSRYTHELENNPAAEKFANLAAEKATLTLLYSSRDHEHNNAVVLKKFLETKFSQGKT